MAEETHAAPSAVDAGNIARFKQLTEGVLPAMARDEGWPIRLDHCFKRICLDWAFGDVWYRHLARPAERHLRGDALQRALACATEVVSGGLPERDAASLRWRGKPAKTPAGRTAASRRGEPPPSTAS